MEPLASAGELENHLQRPVDGDVADQALQLASGAVRAFCKWDLSQVAETLYADGNGSVVCTLPTLELVDVLEVRLDGVVVELDPTTLSWSRKGQLYRPTGWPAFSSVEVDCLHGYDPIPDVLKLVTLDLAARSMTNPDGWKTATTGRVSRTFGDAGLSALHERLLARYSL